MKDMHPIQADVLKKLQFVDDARFNELKPDNMTSDHFNFHIKTLIDRNLIIKNENGHYQLTTESKSFANRLAKEGQPGLEKQPKSSLLLVARRQRDGVQHYAVQHRTKQPFRNHRVFPTWRVKWGEAMADTAAKALNNLTGLIGDPQVLAQIRRRDYDDEQAIYDVLLHLVFFDEPDGELKPDPWGAEHAWMTQEQMLGEENLTGIPPYVFKILSDPEYPRFLDLGFEINTDRF